MRVKSMAVEGYGPLGSFAWKPGALTVLEGEPARALGRALGHFAQAARGWSTLSDSLAGAADDLAASPRDEHGEGETRWWICLGAPDGDPTGRDFTAECVIGRYPGGWEMAFERVCRSDDFTEEEVVGRQGMRTTYSLPFTLRSMSDRAKREVHTVARDMSVLGALVPLQRDARVAGFVEALGAAGYYAPRSMTQRLDRLYGGYHTRLAEGGDNLVNVLAEIHSDASLAPVLDAVLGATVEGFVGYTLGFNDVAECFLRVDLADGTQHSVSTLPDVAWQALTTLAVLATPAPPPWVWLDGLGVGLPESLAPRFVALARTLAGKSQLVLCEPAPAVREGLRVLGEGPDSAGPVALEGYLAPGADGVWGVVPGRVVTGSEVGGAG